MSSGGFPAWLAAHAHHTSEELALAVKVLRLVVPGTCP